MPSKTLTLLVSQHFNFVAIRSSQRGAPSLQTSGSKRVIGYLDAGRQRNANAVIGGTRGGGDRDICAADGVNRYKGENVGRARGDLRSGRLRDAVR